MGAARAMDTLVFDLLPIPSPIMKLRHILFATALFAAVSTARANTTSVGWGNSPFDTALLDSQGNTFDDTFAFQLGTFVSGFTPTAGNTSLWLANWKLLDTATSPVNSSNHGFNVTDQYFTSAFTFNTNGTVEGLSGSATFAANEQAYIWVQCTNGEWALVTDSAGTAPDDIWKRPDPNGAFPTTLTWGLETADTAIVGSLNGTYNGTSGNIDYRLQTAQIAVVPEPSGALMVLLVGCVARVVRTRRRLA